MNDNLIPLTTETQSLMDALLCADIHVGGLSSKNAKTMGELVERRPRVHSPPQINQD